MKFERPDLLILIAVPVVLAAIHIARVRLRSLSAALVLNLRVGVCALLVVALAKPYRESKRGVDRVVALLDVSASVTDAQGDEMLQSAKRLADSLGLQLQLAPFGKGTAPLTVAYEGGGFANVRRSWDKLGLGATNLEGVLSTYSAASTGSMLLLSDGYETEGSVGNFLAGHSSTAVYPIAFGGGPEEGSVQITQLFAPLTARAQKSVDIRTTLTNPSRAPKSGLLEVKHGSNVVLSKQVTLDPGQDTVVSAQSNPSLEGLNEITATFSWQDSGASRSVTRTTWLSGEKRDKVLVVSGTADDDRFLSQLLRGQAFQLQSEVGGSSLRSGVKPSDFRVIVLNNLPRAALPPAFLEAVPTFLKSGGGLIMIGGNQSFGLGGYIGSAVEDLLLVKLIPPHAEKKRLNVAVQLVLDKSRSMAQDNRLEFAKDGAAQLIRSLKDDDYIGVIGFDDIPYIALPMAPVGNVRDVAVEKIGRLFPTRKTNLFPAMDEGRRALTRINAGRKHMVILTDGKLPDAGSYYLELVGQMRTLGMTVSTVLVGDEYDGGFLKQIADTGGGAFYQTSDPSNLPRIFLSDVRVSSGEQSLKENPDIPVRLGPSGLQSTTVDSYPILRGFVENASRDGANTELVVRSEGETFPLLASWNVGKGRSIAFTSDANGRWSSNWIRWENINEFWSDLVESANPRMGGKKLSFNFDLRSWVDGSELVIDVVVYEELAGRRLGGHLTSPDGARSTIDLTAISPGHYQARTNRPIPGKYLASLAVDDDPLPDVAWTLSGELFGEKTHSRPNNPLLEQIASRTGGKVNPSAEDLRGTMKFETNKRDTSLRFLVSALLLLFLEIVIREFVTIRLRKRGRS